MTTLTLNQGTTRFASLAPLCLAVSPAASSPGPRQIRSLSPRGVKMFELHKLYEVMPAQFSGLHPNSPKHSGLRLSLNCAKPGLELCPRLRWVLSPGMRRLGAREWGF
jgi:hypothetical protein